MSKEESTCVRDTLYYKIISVLRTYLLNIETKETQTTTKSKTLKADLKKAPLCRMHPYEIVLRINSTENIPVKM